MPVKKIEIIIRPLAGITRIQHDEKNINFGMMQADVEAVLGAPTQYTVNNLIKNVVEPRDGMQFIYELNDTKNTALDYIEIPIGAGLIVSYEGVNFFEDSTEDVVSKLSRFDTPTPDNGKYMNFYQLGICLGGYGRKRIPEKKLVRVFPAEKQKSMEMMFKIGGGKI